MDEFIKKWKNDKKYQAKIKLIFYGVFIILAVLYISSLNKSIPKEDKKDDIQEKEVINDTIIDIPNTYHYDITIDLDNNIYRYYGNKDMEKTTITKETGATTNYLYQNNEYYIDDNGTYVKTTKEEVYDLINYNYLDLNNINNYLKNATKEDNSYKVYLKDLILDDNTDEFITITIDNNKINIDYTSLMKKINNNEKCIIDIQINE